ncbi:GPO family capsid scaffolding protein, partial [Escherichia coli]|uniref:GPO family capsid scaffolding protein n=1 Tax=Escherichia coli TaxID=562 RepID=UPI003B51EB92
MTVKAKRFRIGVEGATTDGREIQREWFTDLLTPVKSTSAELQSAAAMGRRFGEALA